MRIEAAEDLPDVPRDPFDLACPRPAEESS